jgi:hypothetical protein
VVINGLYWAKVSDKLVKVRILRRLTIGGWSAENQSTKREIHIRSAQRLRERCDPPF